MTHHLRLSTCDEWFEIDLYSAVLIDIDSRQTSAPLLRRLAALRPSFVGFVGATSEGWHDAFDEIVVAEEQEVLTTWHSDEEVAEVVAEFLGVHVPLSSKSGDAYIIDVGEGRLIEAAKCADKT